MLNHCVKRLAAVIPGADGSDHLRGAHLDMLVLDEQEVMPQRPGLWFHPLTYERQSGLAFDLRERS